MNAPVDDDLRLVTIEYFTTKMLGFKSKTSYYNHLDDPGFPQRVWPGGKPMLVYAECRRYIEERMADRRPPDGPVVKARSPNATGKAGRPRKAISAEA